MHASPAQKVVVKLTQKNQGKIAASEDIKATVEPDRPFELKRDLTLQEGLNLIEVTAENAQTLAGFESEERGFASLNVQYEPKAPSILVKEVIPILSGDQAGEPLPLQPGQSLTVDQARVRVAGLIQAEENVLPPEWDMGPDSERKKVAVKLAAKELPFQFEVDLQPGEQRVRIFARTAQSKEVTDSIGSQLTYCRCRASSSPRRPRTRKSRTAQTKAKLFCKRSCFSRATPAPRRSA